MLRKKLLITFCLFACSSEKTIDDTSNGSTETEVEQDASFECPDDVPEAYRSIWDCGALGCDPGKTKVYRYAEASSTADGQFIATEKWFGFDGSSYWVDTFEITGEAFEIDPITYDCSYCEEVFEVYWQLTDHQSNWVWSKTFADQESEEQRYYGFLMFDTHTSITDERNPDNKVAVVAAPVRGIHHDSINDYGEGTATPTSDVDGMPEDYIWANSGVCYGN